jgi:hypothetical protein
MGFVSIALFPCVFGRDARSSRVMAARDPAFSYGNVVAQIVASSRP